MNPLRDTTPLSILRETIRQRDERSARSAKLRLTKKNQAIYDLMIQGYQEKDIILTLGITKFTFRNHRARIYLKRGVHSQTQLIAQYYEAQLKQAQKQIDELKQQGKETNV